MPSEDERPPEEHKDVRAARRERDRIRKKAQRGKLNDAAKERTRLKDRQYHATAAAKEADRKRKAQPDAKEAARERMAQPHVKEADCNRKKHPKALAAHRQRLANANAKRAGDDLGDRHACPHCGAPMWKCAGLTCCGGGAHVALRPPPPPPELLRWVADEKTNPWTEELTGGNVPWESRIKTLEQSGFAGTYVEPGFSAASRRLNNNFAFSAIGTDTGPKGRSGGAARDDDDAPFMVRLAGRVYHYIPSADSVRSNIPYYVNDTLPSVPQESDAAWVRTLHATLMRVHPLAKTLRAAREVDAREVRIVPDPSRPKPECTTEISARYRITTDIDDMPSRNFVVFTREGGQQWYPTLNHDNYESVQYPLIYMHGTLGWWAKKDHDMYKSANGETMTLMWYARQRLFCERTLHVCGRLLNEWLVDMFCRIDDNRLNYLATAEGQKKLRIAETGDIEHYCEDTEAGKGADPDKPGRILLPSSHTGSKRQMWTLLQNACALSLRRKKATFFDTMTCNGKWPEIKRCLHPG
eukprot:gene10177-390_t